MAHGTLANLSTSAFVRTPPLFAERIVRNILSFPQEAVSILDPTAGEGDLLAPCQAFPNAHLYGVEISADRADAASKRLPTATILTGAFEGISCTPGSMSLVLANPPYFFSDGKRAEYRIIADAGTLLMPGGIMVAIIPARSAWDGTMINHWAKWYDQVHVWKFPDRSSQDEEGAFEDYTQICVLGVRLATPRVPDTAQKKRLSCFRWRKPEKIGQSPWEQGFPPPDLPDEPMAVPYVVPAAIIRPSLIIKHADEVTLLHALAQSGAHLTPAWQAATTWPEEGFVDAPAMPPTGEAHLAADILTGLLDGEIVSGPDDAPHLFTSFVTQEWVSIEIDEEEREKQRERGVVNLEVRQQQDKPILGVLNLASGLTNYYQGEEVFTYLKPWLSTLATRVIEKRKPLYQLDPEEWEIRVVSKIGMDKQLPGAEFPGLAVAQQHRVYAMSRAIDAKGRTAIQGEPGTGKTRMGIATAARMAYRWRQRNATEFRQQARPEWIKQLRRAWLTNPTTRALLGVEPFRDGKTGQVVAYRHKRSNRVVAPELLGPSALPILVSTPKKVTKEWSNEIQAAWPQAEVLFIKDYHDVARWMERCATSPAPAVIGIFSHSTSRAFGRAWQPVVREVSQTNTVPDLEPDPLLKEQIEAVHDRNSRLVAYQFKETGQVLTKDITISYYYCPDCMGRIEASPRGVQAPDKAVSTSSPSEIPAERDEEETLEPVTSLTWFKSKQRWCTCEIDTRVADGSITLCKTPLWADARTEATQQKYPQVSFADWSQAIEVLTTGPATKQSGTGTLSRSAKSLSTVRPAPGVRLATAENGPLVVIEPDLSTAEGYEPVRDEHGDLIAYRLSQTGQELLPIYGLWSRRVVGYVEGETGKLVTRMRQFDLCVPPPDSFSPYEYLYRFYKGCVALSIIDESHNGRGRSTDIAHSLHLAKLSSQARMNASGTHYGGDLDDFFYYWYRFNPQFWLRLGLGWNDVEKAISRYGVIQQWTKEYESEARRGSGRTDVQVSTIPAPGISARIIPPLLEDLCYLTVLDVGAHMPPRIEIPEVVPMVDPELERAGREVEQARVQAERELADLQKANRQLLQEQNANDERERLATALDQREVEIRQRVEEARSQEVEVKEWVTQRNLAHHYLQMVKRLEDLARERNNAARLAKGTVPRWFAALPCESAFEVTQTQKDDWGDVTGKQLLLRTPVLAADYLYPLEKRLIEIVRRELSERRRVMIYFEQNDIRSMARRLEWVLKEHTPWTLPNKVEAEDRQEAILAAVASGHRVVIVPYRRVNEGLNLQRGIDTIVWFEMPMNLFMLDQASRRAWRLGKQEEVRIYYLVYAGTVGHSKLRKLGSQSGAAAAFSGEPARGALIEHAGANKTTLARLSHSLEAMDEEEIPFFSEHEDETEALKAVFARRGEELRQALKRGRQWMGVVDTLPERLAAIHAETTMARPEPIIASMNGSVVVEAEMAEVLPETLNEEISLPVEAATVMAVLDLQQVGSNMATHSSSTDSPVSTGASSNGAVLLPVPPSSTPVNGTNGHTARPTWGTLLHILEAEKARKESLRSRRKQPENAASTTHATHLWEILQEGGEPSRTTLNTTKAEELMPDTTKVSQASLW